MSIKSCLISLLLLSSTVYAAPHVSGDNVVNQPEIRCAQQPSGKDIRLITDTFVYQYVNQPAQVRTDLMSQSLQASYVQMLALEREAVQLVRRSKNPADKPWLWETDLLSGSSDWVNPKMIMGPQVQISAEGISALYRLNMGDGVYQTTELILVCEAGQYNIQNIYYDHGDNLEQMLTRFINGFTTDFLNSID